jgi:hypothetical protein
MSRYLVVLLAILIGLTSGCRRDKLLVGEHPSELVGTWRLLVRSSCSEYGLKTDTLVLYADGRFDQHVAMNNNGKKFDLSAQHWSYDSSDQHGHIALDKRLEFFAPEHSEGSIRESATFEDLLLEIDLSP